MPALLHSTLRLNAYEVSCRVRSSCPFLKEKFTPEDWFPRSVKNSAYIHISPSHYNPSHPLEQRPTRLPIADESALLNQIPCRCRDN